MWYIYEKLNVVIPQMFHNFTNNWVFSHDQDIFIMLLLNFTTIG